MDVEEELDIQSIANQVRILIEAIHTFSVCMMRIKYNYLL